MVKEDLIQFVGVSKLAPDLKDTLNKLSTEYFKKIKRSVKNVVAVKVHVKTTSDTGSRKKFSLHVFCDIPGKTYDSNKHHDFDLAKATHQAFNSLLNEIRHTHHDK